jgi:hypothetical protein
VEQHIDRLGRWNPTRFTAREAEERFWEKVDKDGPGGCWLWTGAIQHRYGIFNAGPGDDGVYRHVKAHRWAWVSLRGPVAEGLELDHLCRVAHCVNPDHIEPVTQQVNLDRANTRPKQLAARTHCKYGHEFSDANTYWAGTARQCRACNAANARRRKQQKRKD